MPKTNLRVLGVDPGYDRLGVAVVEVGHPKPRLIFSDCLLSDKKLSFAERLLSLGVSLEKILKKQKPDIVAIENLFFSVNQKTAIRVAETRGLVIYLCAERHLSIFEYNPMEVKTCTTGYGGADKKQIIGLLKKQIEVKKDIKYDDEFDAIALALTHLAHAPMRKLWINYRS